jgi:hypothetical protein
VCRAADVEAAQRIAAVDLRPYRANLTEGLTNAMTRAAELGANAVYWEFDTDNGWASAFFLCKSYSPEQNGNDDSAPAPDNSSRRSFAFACRSSTAGSSAGRSARSHSTPRHFARISCALDWEGNVFLRNGLQSTQPTPPTRNGGRVRPRRTVPLARVRTPAPHHHLSACQRRACVSADQPALSAAAARIGQPLTVESMASWYSSRSRSTSSAGRDGLERGRL